MEERKRKINEFEKIVINENHTTKVKLFIKLYLIYILG
jgi:hypothetical protein